MWRGGATDVLSAGRDGVFVLRSRRRENRSLGTFMIIDQSPEPAGRDCPYVYLGLLDRGLRKRWIKKGRYCRKQQRLAPSRLAGIDAPAEVAIVGAAGLAGGGE